MNKSLSDVQAEVLEGDSMSEDALQALAIAYAVKQHKIKSDNILAIDIRKRVITKAHIYLKGSPIKVIVEFDKDGKPTRSYIEELALPVVMP